MDDVRRYQLSKSLGPVAVPDIKLDVCPEYSILAHAVRLALEEEWRNNINQSLHYLLGRKAVAAKYTILKDMFDGVITLFLLKACFYVDLKIQTRQNISDLLELIKFAVKGLP